MSRSTTKSWFIVFLVIVLLSATTLAAAQEAAKLVETDESNESWGRRTPRA